jgi:hypothetical protein
MKKIIAAIAATTLALSGISAAMLVGATPAQAQNYTGRVLCVAQSPNGWGYGAHLDRDTACRIALRECAVRTPYGQVCYVTRVDWERY